MHEFKYKGNDLYCEDVKIAELAEHFGTPLYVYSKKTLEDHYRKLADAFGEIDPLICYSVKANSNLAILKILTDAGAGLDIVSGGELSRAQAVGVDSKRIVYAGVGKTAPEIDAAIKEGILLFNAESIPELELINERAKALKKNPHVALRINPNIAAKTHKYITTGKEQNKFGVDFNTAKWVFLNSGKFPNILLRGIHIHIGSQIIESGPFVKAIERTRDFVAVLGNQGVKIEYFDIGGGLGIIYKKEKPQTADEYAKAILPILRDLKVKIILEPGRFIVGNAGILVTRVTYVKKTKSKNFVIVDAGMNDLVRPTLYEAYHEILPAVKSQSQKSKLPPDRRTGKSQKFDVVGPICESGDFFALDRKMVEPTQGDLLAIMSAGAYGFSMSSNYNSRPRPCEVMVSAKKACEIRKREEYKDLIKGEAAP